MTAFNTIVVLSGNQNWDAKRDHNQSTNHPALVPTQAGPLSTSPTPSIVGKINNVQSAIREVTKHESLK